MSSDNSTADSHHSAQGPDSSGLQSIGGKPVEDYRERHSDHPTVVSKKSLFDAEEFCEPKTHFGENLVGVCLGEYYLEEYLGCGGMGAVFRATGEGGVGEVALKVLRPNLSDKESIRRFRNEANNLAILNHRNIASVYQIGKDQGWNFIVLEYVPGKTLFQYVQEHGPLDVDTLVALFSQLSQALQHAHNKGIVHRDLKPSNVLFSDSGQVKLVDMGLALLQTDGNNLPEVDEKDLTIGTVDYLSPEQARDPGTVDLQSDLYSLGCMMFFALTGKAPFHDRPALKKLLNHSAPQRPSVRTIDPSIPAAIDSLIMKLMAVDKNERPKDAEEFRTELQRVKNTIDWEIERQNQGFVERRKEEEIEKEVVETLELQESRPEEKSPSFLFIGTAIFCLLMVLLLIAFLFQ